MHTIDQPSKAAKRIRKPEPISCYHCGTPCLNGSIAVDDKCFCCEGCKTVYELINDNGLYNYYQLQNHPGSVGMKIPRRDKYQFLDNSEIIEKLIRFTDGDRTIVTFYIPGVHCSSCMWLLEHLRRLDEGILDSRLDFGKKEVTIQFAPQKISLREVVELMTAVGYEPYISLEDTGKKEVVKPNRSRLYKLGVAGFCFANIMMMSFPEYLGGAGFEHKYALLLRTLNLILALPVFFFSATEFFFNAWKGLKAHTLNIDAPIALAIIITFSRSLYEIISGIGAGYLDSMSGIVFFMLVGRLVQERTYRSINFQRDYQSYFPVAVSVETDAGMVSRQLKDLKAGDVIMLHNDEIIPADSVVQNGTAYIDYSFVTGESKPQKINVGGKVYAGGRQTGDNISIELQQTVAGSYLTSLWSHDAFRRNKTDGNGAGKGIDRLSRYFTFILFSLALITGLYWATHDPSRVLNAVTAMLIVACPCALLLSSTFTNGNLLRIFSNAGLFLRDVSVIEQLGKTDTIVFDKTGTLTNGYKVTLHGAPMGDRELALLHAATKASSHPYSRLLADYSAGCKPVMLEHWIEWPGRGVSAEAYGLEIRVGNAGFTNAVNAPGNVHVCIGKQVYSFTISSRFRSGVRKVFRKLKPRFRLVLLSGDNDQQRPLMERLFGLNNELLFGQKPVDKLNVIAKLQERRRTVLMIGDGLNDAGALQQSNVGITLTDDINNFTPACDAILNASRLSQLPAFLRMARVARFTIAMSFAVSILYNLAGLYFAIQGRLNPMIAAILMPASTLSIVLISTGLTTLCSYILGLRRREQ